MAGRLGSLGIEAECEAWNAKAQLHGRSAKWARHVSSPKLFVPDSRAFLRVPGSGRRRGYPQRIGQALRYAPFFTLRDKTNRLLAAARRLTLAVPHRARATGNYTGGYFQMRCGRPGSSSYPPDAAVPAVPLLGGLHSLLLGRGCSAAARCQTLINDPQGRLCALNEIARRCRSRACRLSRPYDIHPLSVQ